MNRATTLPSILPGETLYSWCSVHHHATCSSSSAQSGIDLLGSSHSVRQHDLFASAGCLPLFAGSTPSDATELLRAHTIAGYYLPFRSIEEQHRIGEMAARSTASTWRRSLFGGSRTLAYNHPLKFCDVCVEVDRTLHGRPYWHTSHQFATTWACHLHGVPLREVDGAAKRWLLPGMRGLPGRAVCAGMMTAHAVLALMGAQLPSISAVSVRRLRQAAVFRLREIGVLHSSRSARQDRLPAWFASTATASALKSCEGGLGALQHGDWIQGLLWRRKSESAVRWILLWSALDWDSATHAGNTFSAAARGTAFSDNCQLALFEETERPASAPDAVKRAFENSSTYADVMRQLQVSRGDVVRWLESDASLRQRWRSQMKDSRLMQHSQHVRNAAAAIPDVTRQELERVCSAQLRWLREHAPEHLRALLKSIPARAAAQRSLF